MEATMEVNTSDSAVVIEDPGEDVEVDVQVCINII
jgi:hypothetical protein